VPLWCVGYALQFCVLPYLTQVRVHIDIGSKVSAITLQGLKAKCLPYSGVTDKMAGAIAKQRKAIAQSGVGFCFPAMAVVDFLPSWAVRAFLCTSLTLHFHVLYCYDAGRQGPRQKQAFRHGSLDCWFP